MSIQNPLIKNDLKSQYTTPSPKMTLSQYPTPSSQMTLSQHTHPSSKMPLSQYTTQVTYLFPVKVSPATKCTDVYLHKYLAHLLNRSFNHCMKYIPLQQEVTTHRAKKTEKEERKKQNTERTYKKEEKKN